MRLFLERGGLSNEDFSPVLLCHSKSPRNDLLGELIIIVQQRMEWLWDKSNVQKLEGTC